MIVQCSICLDEIHQHSSLCVLNCKHVFHDNCLKEWAQYGFECPCCRAPFQAINLNPSLYSNYYDEVEWDFDGCDEYFEEDEEIINESYVKDVDADLHVVLDIQMRNEMEFKNGDIVKVLDVDGNGISSLFIKRYDDWLQLDNMLSDKFVIDYLCEAYGENITSILPQNVLEVVIDGLSNTVSVY